MKSNACLTLCILPDPSASLAKELREMSHDDFLKLLHGVYASLLRCVYGVQAQSQVMTVLLESISYAAL